jgi:hypothetical protein
MGKTFTLSDGSTARLIKSRLHKGCYRLATTEGSLKYYAVKGSLGLSSVFTVEDLKRVGVEL